MIRRRGAAWLAGALLVGVGTGCGGSAQSRPRPGSIAWQGPPQLFAPRGLDHDRVLIGRVRNNGASMLKLLAGQVVVRDAGGRVIPGATAGFLASYAHGLFGALQQPSQLPDSEMARLGRLLFLFGGSSAPFFAAWHLPGNTSGPVTIQIGPSRLKVPTAPAQLTAR